MFQFGGNAQGARPAYKSSKSMTADTVGYRKDARRYSMSATWLGVKLALVVGVPAFERLFARQDLKGQLVTEELKETIQAFRAMGAEIELRPILDYLASR